MFGYVISESFSEPLIHPSRRNVRRVRGFKELNWIISYIQKILTSRGKGRHENRLRFILNSFASIQQTLSKEVRLFNARKAFNNFLH